MWTDRQLQTVRAFATDSSGATLAEFALVLSLFSMVAIAGLAALNTNATASLDGISNQFTSQGVTPP